MGANTSIPTTPEQFEELKQQYINSKREITNQLNKNTQNITTINENVQDLQEQSKLDETALI